MLDLCEQEDIAFLPWAPIQDADANDALGEVASRHRVSTTQIVLAWLLARSPAMLAIPGTGSVAHVEDNVTAATVRLDDDDVRALSGFLH
jgi:aryl-alcohol dehydrogenase-like predicted oxidoreductase